MKYLKTFLLAASLFGVLAQADETVAQNAPAKVSGGNAFAVLFDQGIASSLRLKDLTRQWRVMRLAGAPEEIALLQAMSGNGGSVSPWDNLYYTRGDVISVGAQMYLVAYRIVPPASLQERRLLQQFVEAWQNEDDDGGSAMLKMDTPPLDENTALALSLVVIGKGTNLNDIRAFDPAKDVMTGKDKASRKIKVERRISQTNLKQVALGMMQFLQDWDEALPPMRAARKAADWANASGERSSNSPVQAMLMPYLRSSEVFLHPGTGRPYLPNYKISRKHLSQIENPAQIFLFFEDAPDAEGKRSVAFLDGHVKAFPEAEFQKMRKAQGISESGLPSAAKPGTKAKAKTKTTARERTISIPPPSSSAPGPSLPAGTSY